MIKYFSVDNLELNQINNELIREIINKHIFQYLLLKIFIFRDLIF